MLSCHSCAIVINNDDDSHLDLDEAVSVTAGIEILAGSLGGPLVLTEVDADGYFDCAVCDQVCLGDAYAIDCANN
ncbi:hypothetical protein SEA_BRUTONGASTER_167 [Gordonia phage BrutonGaster]|uniref:Uncharacterized protein n=1 Tax=Gordonia phage BrutonGaster TaxID=2530116 RepID=A0A482JHX3_9CAUD|nr:hypothetical protein HOV26_gp015 [Gordonia phage BrutonGaster]QBP33381.1 hypothetical protein SEA_BRUTONGASTER_167 [Gordonia phage BrutonGaster]